MQPAIFSRQQCWLHMPAACCMSSLLVAHATCYLEQIAILRYTCTTELLSSYIVQVVHTEYCLLQTAVQLSHIQYAIFSRQQCGYHTSNMLSSVDSSVVITHSICYLQQTAVWLSHIQYAIFSRQQCGYHTFNMLFSVDSNVDITFSILSSVDSNVVLCIDQPIDRCQS